MKTYVDPSKHTASGGTPFKCETCRGLRPLEFHLHELSRYCDLLDNSRTAIRNKGFSSSDTTTSGISKWLLLSSQVHEVLMDTSQFEEAHLYCEPVLDLQKSDANHRGSLATRLTRFVFFCNALEETYRFSELSYDRLNKGKKSGSRSRSMKAAAVLKEYSGTLKLPADFGHLSENLFKLTKIYETGLSVKLERSVQDTADITLGLDLVRCLRNHVAHGIFPILENPEYSWKMSPELHRAVLNLLNQAVRVGTLNIQLLLAVDNDGFRSQLYDELSDDPETGDYFSRNCTSDYLLSLHRNQDFGLNERSYFRWSDQSA